MACCGWSLWHSEFDEQACAPKHATHGSKKRMPPQGLGLVYAQQLALTGVQALVLTSRSAQLPQEELEALAAAGVAVFTVTADAGCPGDLQSVLAWVQEALPACQQMVHAAGVSGFSLLADMRDDGFWTVAKPKVRDRGPADGPGLHLLLVLRRLTWGGCDAGGGSCRCGRHALALAG